MSNETPNGPGQGAGKYLTLEQWEALKAAGFSEAELYDDQPTGPILYSYTRKQAIADGVLVDLTRPGFARLLAMLGIRIHTAITATAFGACVSRDFDREHVDQMVGNALRMLVCFREAIDKSKDRNTDRVFFEAPGLDGQPVSLWAMVGPGDDAEPVMTIMLEGED